MTRAAGPGELIVAGIRRALGLLVVPGVVIAAVLTSPAVAYAGAATPAAAAGDPPAAGSCDNAAVPCVEVGTPGSNGGAHHGDPGTGSGGRGGGAKLPDDGCITSRWDPPPPKSDPHWGGHTDGALYFKACPVVVGYQGAGNLRSLDIFWAATPPAAVTVTPAELARQAMAAIVLPKPVVHRSPDETNSDGGVPYTWVNLYTWFWTDPAVWTPIERTASVPGVWATVTVAPTRLLITPGDGSADVPCDGPGRAWTTADGNADPKTLGACGVKFLEASRSTTSTLSIEWTATWVGSTGDGGDLGQPATRTDSTFSVQQIQVVNR